MKNWPAFVCSVARRTAWACHAGPDAVGRAVSHDTGVAWRDGRYQDDGRAGVSGRDHNRGAFKTPTLREVARTAP